MKFWTVLSAAVLSAAVLISGCDRTPTIVIGSKNFTEQVLLGEIVAQQIERATDYPVDRRLNLGGTFICDQALRAGGLDAYVEYTGTAFTAILQREPIRDGAEVFRRVQAAYREEGLQWLSPLGFNNTFAVLVRRSEAEKLGVHTLSEAAAFSSQWTPGFGYEFIERQDGFQGLVETYGLKFAEAPRVMELGLIYRALADGQIDLTAGDSTNGLIDALDLRVLRDDQNYFPPYDAAIVVRLDALREFTGLESALQTLSGSLSEEKMRALNYQVDGQNRLVPQVAAEFLKDVPRRPVADARSDPSASQPEKEER